MLSSSLPFLFTSLQTFVNSAFINIPSITSSDCALCRAPADAQAYVSSSWWPAPRLLYLSPSCPAALPVRRQPPARVASPDHTELESDRPDFFGPTPPLSSRTTLRKSLRPLRLMSSQPSNEDNSLNVTDACGEPMRYYSPSPSCSL